MKVMIGIEKITDCGQDIGDPHLNCQPVKLSLVSGCGAKVLGR